MRKIDRNVLCTKIDSMIVRYGFIFKERNRDDRRYRKKKIDNIERQGERENINREWERKTEISNRDKKRETERHRASRIYGEDYCRERKKEKKWNIITSKALLV